MISIIKISRETYEHFKPNNACDYPIEELDYLLELSDGKDKTYALIDDRLWEME